MFVSTLFVYVRMIIFTVVDFGRVYKELYDLPIILLNLATIFLYLDDTAPVIRGGMGVTSAWSPLGNFLEGPSTPKCFCLLPFIEPGFSIFCDVKFFVFAFRWFRVFH